MISMVQILKTAVRENASDIHITPGVPPILRVKGEIVKLNVEPLAIQQTTDLCYSIITDNQKKKFETEKDLDFSFSIGNTSRFRGHIYYQKRSVCGAFRQIPIQIPNLSDLGLPPILGELGKKPYGLILVTGPTGSGKTTSLAAMLNEINKTRKAHILTIEDPIEFIYEHDKCIVNQREVGFDSLDFHSTLKASLRMDPDICLLGELRDEETIRTALHIAETGHLTFGTLHTNNAFQTIDRLTGVFTSGERGIIQSQLSQVLQGIISQRLLPSVEQNRVAAVEVLLFPPSVRNLVKEGKQNQIYSIMQTQSALGMITMNHSLVKLLSKGLISEEIALSMSYEVSELKHMIEKLKKNRSFKKAM